MDKKAILAVSFGTSYQDTLERTIGAIEKELAAVFPDRILLRAFTSGMICRKLKQRDGIVIPSPAQALEQMLGEGGDRRGHPAHPRYQRRGVRQAYGPGGTLSGQICQADRSESRRSTCSSPGYPSTVPMMMSFRPMSWKRYSSWV